MMYVVRKILSGLENIASTPDAEALVRISEAQMINLTEQQEGG